MPRQYGSLTGSLIWLMNRGVKVTDPGIDASNLHELAAIISQLNMAYGDFTIYSSKLAINPSHLWAGILSLFFTES